jgi:hypothetical protein
MKESDKYFGLILGLLKATKKRTAHWQPTAADETYQGTVGRFAVQIQARGSAYPNLDYYILIFNKDGTLIEEFSNLEFDERSLHAHRLMRELHTSARRQALGADTAIDELLELLPKDDDVY